MPSCNATNRSIKRAPRENQTTYPDNWTEPTFLTNAVHGGAGLDRINLVADALGIEIDVRDDAVDLLGGPLPDYVAVHVVDPADAARFWDEHIKRYCPADWKLENGGRDGQVQT